MGRWGEGIYESDSSLDFFVMRVSDRIEREMAYLFSPEHIRHTTFWLRKTLMVVELMLLFDQHRIGTTTYLMDELETAKRWKTSFFRVWDAEWDDDKDEYFPYRTYDYRLQSRQIVGQWFARLEQITSYYDLQHTNPNYPFFKPRVRLPHFSITQLQSASREQYYASADFADDLIDAFLREIVFVLSDRNRENAIGFWEIEPVWVSVDIIRFLCDIYRSSPHLLPDTVDEWQSKTVEIWQASSEENIQWNEDNPMYQNLLSSFRQLKDVAVKYPAPSFFSY